MDKQRTMRIATRSVAVIAVPVGVAVVAWPRMNRTNLVASHGVLSANNITLVMTVVGIMMIVAATAWMARGYVIGKTNQLLLPARDETDLEKIERSLSRVVKRYPDVAKEINEGLDRLEAITQELVLIDSAYRDNLELVIGEDTDYVTFLTLEAQLRQKACSNLVGIPYAAKRMPNGDIESLRKQIVDVNAANQEKLDAVRKLKDLTDNAVARSYNGHAVEEINSIIEKNTDRKEELS